MEMYGSDGSQGIQVYRAMKRLTASPKQAVCCPNHQGSCHRWPTCADLRRQQSRDAFKTWWSTEAPESYKPLNLERRPLAALRSSRSQEQRSTASSRRDLATETSPTTTNDLIMTTRVLTAHADDAKHQSTHSTAGRYRHGSV
ncbi:hypothetical protein Purlil1_12532 [Purpureocillium lilacinum]|uniref:Uncharacterized protein n=1 Tax=Purpureocillium lilacinum TaxID=33203 RepID=A0ABR0BGM8_PURLI|nr:hypothetical protein Purlil1_12532 [Purpureocillium lilacinum]